MDAGGRQGHRVLAASGHRPVAPRTTRACPEPAPAIAMHPPARHWHWGTVAGDPHFSGCLRKKDRRAPTRRACPLSRCCEMVDGRLRPGRSVGHRTRLTRSTNLTRSSSPRSAEVCLLALELRALRGAHALCDGVLGQARAGAGGDELAGDLVLGLERVVGLLEPRRRRARPRSTSWSWTIGWCLSSATLDLPGALAHGWRGRVLGWCAFA